MCFELYISKSTLHYNLKSAHLKMHIALYLKMHISSKALVLLHYNSKCTLCLRCAFQTSLNNHGRRCWDRRQRALLLFILLRHIYYTTKTIILCHINYFVKIRKLLPLKLLWLSNIPSFKIYFLYWKLQIYTIKIVL